MTEAEREEIRALIREELRAVVDNALFLEDRELITVPLYALQSAARD